MQMDHYGIQINILQCNWIFINTNKKNIIEYKLKLHNTNGWF